MADRRHADRETLSSRWDRPAGGSGHRASEGSRHDARHCRPRARTEAHRMHLDLNGGAEDEECLEVLDMAFDTLRFMAVRPRHHDIICVALAQPVPLLVADNIEIQDIEDLEVLLDCRRLALRCGR